jgi:hypothetical protein
LATPTVALNNSTGSDTAASGAGPATALTGVLGATNTNTTVNITDAVNLAGVAVDGSAVLWLKSASGLQFSQITAISGSSGAWVVTVATAYAATATGKTWAIGGKRATLDHADTRHVGTDWKPGWTIDIQQTGTSYTLTSAFVLKAAVNSVTADKPCTLTSSSVTRPIITTATNSINMFDLSSSDPIIVRNIAFSNTAGTKGTYAAGTGMCFTVPTGNCLALTVINCTFDGFVSAIMGDNIVLFQIQNALSVIGTEIKNCTDRAIGHNNAGPLHIDRCWIHNNAGDGVNIPSQGSAVAISNSTFSSNGGRGFYCPSTAASVFLFSFIANDFKGNTLSGIEHAGNQFVFICHDNIFVSNLAWGIKLSTTEATINSARPVPMVFRNAYYNNTSGTISNGPPDTGDNITLTGDPFNGSTDFGLNSTAGAGAAVKTQTPNAPNVSANANADIGAIPSGGGAAAAIGGPIAGNFHGGFVNG